MVKSSFIFSKASLPSSTNLDLLNFKSSLLNTFTLNLSLLILREFFLIGFIDIDSIYVENSGVGVAVKDGSRGNVVNSSFKDIGLNPLMTYKKKSFYGNRSNF